MDSMPTPQNQAVPLNKLHVWARMARKLAGMSQETVAEDMAYSTNKYQRIEYNKIDPTVGDIRKLVQALGFKEVVFQMEHIDGSYL